MAEQALQTRLGEADWMKYAEAQEEHVGPEKPVEQVEQTEPSAQALQRELMTVQGLQTPLLL